MGTRSVIAVMHGSNAKAVYCHWDGYLEHNGAILFQYYNTSPLANHLVSLGDISSLGTQIGEAHPFSQFDIDKEDPDYNKLIALHELAEKEGWSTFYGRDRGETDTEHKTFTDFDQFEEYFDSCGAEYAYIMKDGEWFMFDCNNRGIRTLAGELQENNIKI